MAHRIGSNKRTATFVIYIRPKDYGEERLLSAVQKVAKIAAIFVPTASLW